MSTILERIEQVAEFEGIKIGALEKKIGASKGVLSRAIAKNTDIQTKWIGKIIENYPIIDANWLLTGYGSMTKIRKAHEMHDDTPIKPFENPENQHKDTQNFPDPTENIKSLIEILNHTLIEKDKQIDRLLTIIEQRKV